MSSPITLTKVAPMSENTPLLPAAKPIEELATKRITPLPLMQIIILGLVRLGEPIALTQIFPYVNSMVEDLHVTDDPRRIGFYSGAIDSVFAVAQLFTVYYWGSLSDKIGRKPVILMGVSGCAVACLMFGLSNSFWWAVAARALAGAFAGNSAVINSAMSEICDETNIGQAFPIASVFWALGSILGPLVGGSLAHAWQSIPLFQIYPYLPPCLVAASLAFISILIGIFFMEETLPSKTDPEKAALLRSEQHSQTLSLRELLSRKPIQRIIPPSFSQAFLWISFEVLFVLFLFTPVEIGGLGRNPSEIGAFLAAGAVLGSLLPIFAFPPLHRRIGNVKLYAFFMSGWVITFLIPPVIGAVVSRTTSAPRLMSTAGVTALSWIMIGVLMACAKTSAMSWSVNMVLLKNAAPNQEALGATFAVMQMVSCVARAIGPTAASSMFAVSVSKNLLGGQLVWYIMGAAAVVGTWTASRVIDGGKSRH